MFEYVCSLEFGSSSCPSTVLWIWGSCCWWLKLGLCEANAASNDDGTTPSDIFLIHLIQFISSSTFIMTFQIYHTFKLQFITSTVTCEYSDYKSQKPKFQNFVLVFGVRFCFCFDGIFLFVWFSIFSSMWYPNQLIRDILGWT